jgi:hypothetical protein
VTSIGISFTLKFFKVGHLVSKIQLQAHGQCGLVIRLHFTHQKESRVVTNLVSIELNSFFGA